VTESTFPKKKKKRQSAAEVQKDLQDQARAAEAEAPARPDPQAQLKKIYIRAAALLAIFWIAAFFIPSWIPKAVVGVLTVAAIGAGYWFSQYVKKSQALGDLLKGADTVEGRKDALERLDKDFKKGDTQATIARAQLEMQEDPQKALVTLEAIQLDKQLQPVADQVRALRAMIHLTQGEAQEARLLVDRLELGKQQDTKTRAMFATVAGEAWARTGNAKKALETLELFNPEDPEFGEVRMQMWRARAYAYAAQNDLKGVGRALKKLADINPQLLAMFVSGKKLHPLLEREAKQMLMRMGAIPRKMQRARM
jgi:hypothetical protein